MASPDRHARLRLSVEHLECRLAPAAAFAEFIDPNPAPGNQFGASVVPLSTGNVVVTSPFDDAGGTDAGAVYLFNGATGALISTLRGSFTNDRVGSNGITPLANGNFLVVTPLWDNGAIADAGAVTFGNGTTGVSGPVSAANSLVGSTANDRIGSMIVTALSTGNYVVVSPQWDDGAVADAGAVTFGNGITGTFGAVSASNSLVGTTAGDTLGSGDGIVGTGLVALSNGNYVVVSPRWDNGSAADVGAVTFGNGTTGISGPVTSANSLVGSTANDLVSGSGRASQVVALSGGNYVVVTPTWDNGTESEAGAVTFGNGMTGVAGPISAANSLVGTATGDNIGSSGVHALSTGNYVVLSPFWDNGVTENVGAVTFGPGTTGVVGPVTATNSLVGSTFGDQIGGAPVGFGGYNGKFFELANGNYVVVSSSWNNGAVVDAGSATLGSGTTGVSGSVSPANSLVGSAPNDFFSGSAVTSEVFALANGNYVVVSPQWNNGAVADVGAVTFGNGTTGTIGPISAANSLIGTSPNDQAGVGDVTALNNGNYVVRSPFWDNGAAVNAGAVTFGNGTTGIVGPISAANSLVGSTSNDQVGSDGASALSNGNYVVVSSSWDNGAVVNAGAATFGSGTTGISGAVSPANSLVGSSSGDSVGSTGVTVLSNGNYVVVSSSWDNGAVVNAGAATFGSGTTGISGAVSPSNSLVGSSSDGVGSNGATPLSNGNYVVGSPQWNNGSVASAGAVTFGSGTTGISGSVSTANSLIGATASDRVGDIQALPNGNYLVRSPLWDNGAFANAGAVTFGRGAIGATGLVTAIESAVGTSANTGLQFVVLDDVNGTFLMPFRDEGGGRVRVGSQLNGFSTSDALIVGGAFDGSALRFDPSSDGTYATGASSSVQPFGSATPVIRSAVADVNNDGFQDTILVTGPGTPIRVAVISGADNSTVLVAPFDPFGGNFTGGGFVAAADLDGDGRAEFAVTPDEGGGPRVSIFSLLANGTVQTKANFFGIDDEAFRGGARAALGDIDDDGTPDLLLAAGFGGGPRVAIFDGDTLLTTRTKLVPDFFAFPEDAETLRNGVFAALGDINGDGFADLVFGGGPGGGPRVYILSGQFLISGNPNLYSQPIANYFVAGNGDDRGGVRIAVKNADGDSKADLVVGSGAGSPAKVRVYLGANFSDTGEPGTFQDINVFGGAVLTDGVYVG